MMQSEFEKLIGKRIESADYKVIEYVYMNHPVIYDGTLLLKGLLELYRKNQS